MVIGGGIHGLTTAIALAEEGVNAASLSITTGRGYFFRTSVMLSW